MVGGTKVAAVEVTRVVRFWIHFFFNIYLFIWLHQVLVVARGIFVVACGIFTCSMRDLAP